VFTRSSKRPANFQQMFGRLLNRVNTLLAPALTIAATATPHARYWRAAVRGAVS